MIERIIFISFMLTIMSFIIYIVKNRYSIPDIFECQRQELMNLANLVNDTNPSEISQGDKN